MQELCAAPGVSVYKSYACAYLSTCKNFVLHLDVSVNKRLCYTCASLSTCKSFVLHLDVSVYKGL